MFSSEMMLLLCTARRQKSSSRRSVPYALEADRWPTARGSRANRKNRIQWEERLKEHLGRNEGRAPDDDGHEGQHTVERGFVFHACLPPKIGVLPGRDPMSRLKKRGKMALVRSLSGSATPQSSRRSAQAVSSAPGDADYSRYRYGEMPFCLVVERRR